jgi:2-oxoglutarate dehydrogenase E1 component
LRCKLGLLHQNMSNPDVSFLHNADPSAIDNLYQQYQTNVESVDFGWRKFFEGFDLGAQKFESGAAISEDALKEINVLKRPR